MPIYRESRERGSRIMGKPKAAELVKQVALKAKEIDWDGSDRVKLATALNQAGILTSSGKPWTGGNIAMFWKRNKPDEAITEEPMPDPSPEAPEPFDSQWIQEADSVDMDSDHAERSQRKTPVSMPTFPDSYNETGERSEDTSHDGEDLRSLLQSPDVATHFKEIAREVFKEMSQSQAGQIVTNVHRTEEPPLPERTGHRENREYDKLFVTVDRILFKLFKKEARRRGVSNSRLVDIILWNYFGKPTLSFQDDPSEEKQ
ncbi:hypothetical protein ACFL2Q_06055 [Thermodesulfobacteriota bacterium]